MRRLGIIDIGSNSMRMAIIQINADGAFRVIDELKESVRLGEQNNGANILSETKIDLAVDTLQFFKDLCDALEVEEYICVATEAVRRALNRTRFVELVKKQLGLEIRVITGLEEAYYDYFGVVNTMAVPDAIIMDIGGSSTELILMRGRKLENSASLPFGAINLSQKFHLEGDIDEQVKEDLHGFLYENIGKLEWIRGGIPLIGVGGSFRNIGKIDRKLKNYPLDITHNYPMASSSLLSIYDLVGEVPAEKRIEIKGLSRDRADIIPGALAEIAVLLRLTGIKEIFISGSGIREGLFYEHLLKGRQPVDDVLDFSLRNILNNYEINKTHARHVWALANKLYVQLYNESMVDIGGVNVLKAAAFFHDSGASLSYYDHHKHSFYKILNSRINGLTHKEIIMAAETALLHRKDEVKISAAFNSFLSSDEKTTIKKLGILLRIAESLDRRQNGNIYEVNTEADKSCFKIKLAARIKPNLEIKDALSVEQSFYSVFKRKLIIEEAG